MLDSLELFEEISHNVFLENTEFILFLNKHDLFVEKLKTSKLSACFPDYDGKRLHCYKVHGCMVARVHACVGAGAVRERRVFFYTLKQQQSWKLFVLKEEQEENGLYCHWLLRTFLV